MGQGVPNVDGLGSTPGADAEFGGGRGKSHARSGLSLVLDAGQHRLGTVRLVRNLCAFGQVETIGLHKAPILPQAEPILALRPSSLLLDLLPHFDGGEEGAGGELVADAKGLDVERGEAGFKYEQLCSLRQRTVPFECGQRGVSDSRWK